MSGSETHDRGPQVTTSKPGAAEYSIPARRPGREDRAASHGEVRGSDRVDHQLNPLGGESSFEPPCVEGLVERSGVRDETAVRVEEEPLRRSRADPSSVPEHQLPNPTRRELGTRGGQQIERRGAVDRRRARGVHRLVIGLRHGVDEREHEHGGDDRGQRTGRDPSVPAEPFTPAHHPLQCGLGHRGPIADPLEDIRVLTHRSTPSRLSSPCVLPR